MSGKFDLNPALLSVAILLSRHEADTDSEFSVSEIERHAKALGLRPKPLLALLGWLPLAKMEPRRDYHPRCIGEYQNHWAYGWDSVSACANVVVDMADTEQFLAWTWCNVLHNTPPLFTVYTFESTCPVPVRSDDRVARIRR